MIPPAPPPLFPPPLPPQAVSCYQHGSFVSIVVQKDAHSGLYSRVSPVAGRPNHERSYPATPVKAPSPIRIEEGDQKRQLLSEYVDYCTKICVNTRSRGLIFPWGFEDICSREPVSCWGFVLILSRIFDMIDSGERARSFHEVDYS